MLGVASCGLLRVDEPPVDYDFEHAAFGREHDELFDALVELLQQAFRQTDGSRRVASLGTVFNGYLHAGSVTQSL